MESNKGASEWRNINTDSDIDDITSDGGSISAITPSPMSYNAVEGPFVEDFNGKAIAQPRIFLQENKKGIGNKKFKIKDKDAGGSPKDFKHSGFFGGE